jgi:hypothetical protein
MGMVWPFSMKGESNLAGRVLPRGKEAGFD